MGLWAGWREAGRLLCLSVAAVCLSGHEVCKLSLTEGKVFEGGMRGRRDVGVGVWW